MKPIFLSLLLLISSTACFATEIAPQTLFRHQITIIGENHHHEDSTKWFLTTVSNYVKNGTCLNVALEIESNQQSILDAVMKGSAPVSSIRIHSIIDYPAYRQMLTGFSSLIADGSCLHIYAIDAPQSAHINRDDWMAEELTSIGKNSTTIALLGNLHSLKHINWYKEANGEPFLAERLQSNGIDVFSVIQDWPLGSCNARQAKLAAAGSLEGHAALEHVLEPVAANLPDNPISAIDMAIVWSCQ